MNWRKRIGYRAGRALFKAATGETPESILWDRDSSYWSIFGLSGFTQKTNAGKTIDPEKAENLGIYFSCKTTLAADFARLPILTYRMIEEFDRERVKDHPVYRLLHKRPNPNMGPMTFFELMMNWALGFGNGRSLITWQGAYPVMLSPVHPTRIQSALDETTGRNYYIVTNKDGSKKTFPAGDVLDFRGPTKNGIDGYSIAGLAREAIALGLSAEEFAARVFSQDATPAIALIHKGQLKDPNNDIPNIKAKWKEEFSGVGNAHGVAVLQDDVRVEKIGINPEDAQLMLTRDFQKKDICQWFNMPPWRVGIYDGSTFASLKELRRDYATSVIHWWAVRVEQEINYKLFDIQEQDEYYSEFLLDAMLRGDHLERSNIHRTYFNIGVESINQISRAENMNGIGPEGDHRWVPLNIQTLENAVNNPLPARDRQSFTGADTGNKAAAFAVALERVIEKQCKALERQSARPDRSTDAAWAQKFFDGQAQYFGEAAAPAVAVSESVMADDIAAFALNWADYQKRLALAALASGSVAELVEEWRESGAAKAAEKLMEEIDEGL